ncbi:Nucleoside-diphosphate-sugar epimerase [Thermomonospora echinospora]|uniref:Nucleoside-diphosphate-sugar epimerase n=1 Tax=Thermomonospora echinospora TaxID=1992 RepID=A0A1H6D7E3_9ACTN|nr:NAD(P)-dependent oxidoreductase [Thermomonospora echinospora]SEG81240.1 Nucleoside-diphosphate-sugar epimerase [Thermomonospora echinospora]
MAILVTGATGRVGSRFVPRLLRGGEPVRVLARDPRRAELLGRLGAEVVIGDLRAAGTLADALEGVDAVVHLGAAFRDVPDKEAVAVNHTATVELAEASLRAGVSRFVHVGTTLVYGNGRGRPARESDEPAPPGWAYTTSKVAAEKTLLRLHEAQGLPLCIVRLAFVYGEGDPHLAESLHWAGDWPPHKRLHLVHHADVGQALLRVLRADGVDGEIYNVADDAPVTYLELQNLNGEPGTAGTAGDRSFDDPWEGIVDTSKIRHELGFRPIYPTVYTAEAAGAL